MSDFNLLFLSSTLMLNHWCSGQVYPLCVFYSSVLSTCSHFEQDDLNPKKRNIKDLPLMLGGQRTAMCLLDYVLLYLTLYYFNWFVEIIQRSSLQTLNNYEIKLKLPDIIRVWKHVTRNNSIKTLPHWIPWDYCQISMPRIVYLLLGDIYMPLAIFNNLHLYVALLFKKT